MDVVACLENDAVIVGGVGKWLGRVNLTPDLGKEKMDVMNFSLPRESHACFVVIIAIFSIGLPRAGSLFMTALGRWVFTKAYLFGCYNQAC